MKIVEKLSSVLGIPAGYRLFARVIRGDAWNVYLREYVKPTAGEKVLDLGCGPADVLEFLPNVNYTGIDISADYISAAQQRFGSRGRFWCNDVGLANMEREWGTFDLVLATGVLHHLDDSTAAKLLELARRASRPGGRLVTLDGCFVPGQSRIARWMLEHDRGKFVRTREQYERLAAAAFPQVELHVKHDLMRIPYTHLIMRCLHNAK